MFCTGHRCSVVKRPIYNVGEERDRRSSDKFRWIPWRSMVTEQSNQHRVLLCEIKQEDDFPVRKMVCTKGQFHREEGTRCSE